jgi:outer membrane phospholipase A
MRIAAILFCIMLIGTTTAAQNNSDIKIPSSFQSMEEKWELTPETSVVHKNLKLQWQFSEGYGETLQDYNHRQATLGVSLSFIEW